MNILVFSEGLGGATTNFIHNQVIDVSQHHQVLYVCLNYQHNPLIDGEIQIKEIKFEQSRLVETIRKRLEWHDIYLSFKNDKFKKSFMKIIEEFKPDLIHAQFGYDALLLFDNLPSLNLPFIVSFRGFDASQKLILKTYVGKLKKLLKRPDVYSIFVCDHLRNNLLAKGITLKNKHQILYSNTDLDFFKTQSSVQKSDVFTFAQISSFREKKGHEYTVKAFHQFVMMNQNEKVKLMLTGEGGDTYQATKELVKRLNLEGQVEFVGWVDRQKAKSILEQAHVGVLHSVTDRLGDQEGIPNALMEAMAMKLPVLSTYHSGIPELVTNHENGILVEEKDIDAFARAMNDTYHNWSLMDHNREKVSQMFERKKHLSTLLAYYEFCKKDLKSNSLK